MYQQPGQELPYELEEGEIPPQVAQPHAYVDINEVVEFLATQKPDMTHVVLTGRNAHADLIEIADLVTEMELVKHPFRSGIKAQIGVEF